MPVEGKHQEATAPTGFNPLRDVMLVIVFFTRLPMPFVSFSSGSLATAAWAFPFAGVLTGGVAGAVFYGTFLVGAPLLIAIILGFVASVVLSGGLHEDGLADVADGFGGGVTREKKLEIMHDSRIGTYGVLALVLSVGLRVAALLAIAQQAGPSTAAAVFFAVGICTRGFLPFVMRALPHARSDGLSKGAGRPGIAGTGMAVILGGLGAMVPFHADVFPVVVALFAAGCGVIVVCIIAKRQIGGQTGDVIGAAQQLGEVTALIVLSVLLGGSL